MDYYRKQLFAYACLHQLRYGKIIKKCKIYNFLTGNIFTMEVENVHDEIIIDYIKKLGDHCAYHVKLFE